MALINWKTIFVINNFILNVIIVEKAKNNFNIEFTSKFSENFQEVRAKLNSSLWKNITELFKIKIP